LEVFFILRKSFCDVLTIVFYYQN